MPTLLPGYTPGDELERVVLHFTSSGSGVEDAAQAGHISSVLPGLNLHLSPHQIVRAATGTLPLQSPTQCPSARPDSPYPSLAGPPVEHTNEAKWSSSLYSPLFSLPSSPLQADTSGLDALFGFLASQDAVMERDGEVGKSDTPYLVAFQHTLPEDQIAMFAARAGATSRTERGTDEEELNGGAANSSTLLSNMAFQSCPNPACCTHSSPPLCSVTPQSAPSHAAIITILLIRCSGQWYLPADVLGTCPQCGHVWFHLGIAFEDSQSDACALFDVAGIISEAEEKSEVHAETEVEVEEGGENSKEDATEHFLIDKVANPPSHEVDAYPITRPPSAPMPPSTRSSKLSIIHSALSESQTSVSMPPARTPELPSPSDCGPEPVASSPVPAIESASSGVSSSAAVTAWLSTSEMRAPLSGLFSKALVSEGLNNTPGKAEVKEQEKQEEKNTQTTQALQTQHWTFHGIPDAAIRMPLVEDAWVSSRDEKQPPGLASASGSKAVCRSRQVLFYLLIPDDTLSSSPRASSLEVHPRSRPSRPRTQYYCFPPEVVRNGNINHNSGFNPNFTFGSSSNFNSGTDTKAPAQSNGDAHVSFLENRRHNTRHSEYDNGKSPGYSTWISACLCAMLSLCIPSGSHARRSSRVRQRRRG